MVYKKVAIITDDSHAKMPYSKEAINGGREEQA